MIFIFSVEGSLRRQWGRNVRAARGHAWSQKELAAVCGLSPGHLSNLEAGRRPFTVEVMWALAGALRLPPDELFPWPKEIPPFPHLGTPRLAA